MDSQIFSLGRVQYALPSNLESLVCTSNILYLCVSPASPRSGPRLVRINLSHPEDEDIFDIPFVAPPSSKSSPASVSAPKHRIFCDPSARHIIISSDLGETFYVYSEWASKDVQSNSSKSAKTLTKLRGLRITSVAWNWPVSFSPSSSTSSSILLGTSDGRIFETVLDGELESFRPFSRNNHEPFVRPLLTLPHSQPVTGLWFEQWSNSPRAKKKIVVLASNKSWLYQFVSDVNSNKASSDDGSQIFDQLLSVYRDTIPKSFELPGDTTIPFSEIFLWRPLKINDSTVDRPRAIAWLSGAGIYHGKVFYSSQEPGEGVIDAAQLLPYSTIIPHAESIPTPEIVPISIILTEFHLVLLYRDRIRAIRILDSVLVNEEMIELYDGEHVIGLTSDPIRKTYWCYSNKSIFEITVVEEDRDIWKVHLDRQSYETALESARKPKEKDLVLGKMGDYLFKQNKYVQSAEVYAKSSRNFEETALKFFDVGDHDALRNYVNFKLGKLKKSESSQRIMLSTWLIEMFLSKLNQLEDETVSELIPEKAENLKTESIILQDDLKQFLRAQKDLLNSDTVLELMASHGRTELALYYSSLSGHSEKVISHWIECQNWSEALNTINKHGDMESFYKYAPVLVQKLPQHAVDFMMRVQLDHERLMPALVPPANKSTQVNKQIIRYLSFQIFQCNNQYRPLHNALVNIHAASSDDDEEELVDFLSLTMDDDPLSTGPSAAASYDLDYALRVCKKYNRLQASVHIYARMGLYEDSVDLALRSGDINLATKYADRPEDNPLLRRKLWLMIARHIIHERQDIKTAVEFLEKTDILKIEDILPFFPNFVIIDDFKEEICKALETCSNNIELLKKGMDQAQRNSQVIRDDISNLKYRFAVIDLNQRCQVCNLPVLSRQFYVFPCHHAFHGDCLINMVTQNMPRYELRRIVELQDQIASETGLRQQPYSQAVTGRKFAAAAGEGLNELRKLILPDALMDFVGGSLIRQTSSATQKAAVLNESAKVEKLKKELDDIVASNCAICEGAIMSLDKPFVLPGEQEI